MIDGGGPMARSRSGAEQRMNEGLVDLKAWTGREEQVEDVVAASAIAKMSATLDRADPAPRSGDAVPLGWHWMFCHDVAARAALGADGHPRRGGFLPPVPLPRRMWAGGRLSFGVPLRVGAAVRRSSTILRVEEKRGRTGPLLFVTVRHDYAGPEGSAVIEEQDLVYRAAPRRGDPVPPPEAPPASADWRRSLNADPVMLFRFSALTFNGHRIHYDHPYATQEEGYPGLVVHGPMLAVLLLDLARRNAPERAITEFRFRGLRPVISGRPFTAAGALDAGGQSCALWIADEGGAIAMRAAARFG